MRISLRVTAGACLNLCDFASETSISHEAKAAAVELARIVSSKCRPVYMRSIQRLLRTISPD